MTDPALKSYIKTTLAQGYSPNAIRARLRQSGYSDRDISAGMTDATGKRVLNTRVLAITAVIIVILILATIIGIKLLTPSPKTITITTAPLVSTVVPGGKITFITTLTSQTTRQMPVSLGHNAVYKKTNQNIAGKTEQITVGQKSATETQITLPDNTPIGEYTIITNMAYAGGKGQARFNFLVEAKTVQKTPQKESPSAATCPTGCDDYNKCTQDTCENGICAHEPIKPCCGDNICEQDEANYCAIDCRKTVQTNQQSIDEAVITARNDLNTAKMMCNAMPVSEDADTCFNTIATELNKAEACESIQDSSARDRCLISFALQGNYDVCEKIDDAYYIKSCLTLQQQNELKGMAAKYAQ